MAYTVDTVVDEITEKMDKAIAHFQSQIDAYSTGKATPALVQDIMVDAYGTKMRLKETAGISTPDARTIAIQPYDATILPDIEKALMMANIGITPMNDGQLIRLPIPELTEDRRKDMVKDLKGKGEEHKINIRNIRREGNDYLKKALKDHELSEDHQKGLVTDIQDLTNKKIDEIASLSAAKEKDLMTV
ncbi:ribosome releasing factor [Lentisphaera araneosa HTCC2155]|jgi:ribosome recycling factor|uniref:Ribosome-recycling factor n=1 Tax=Lentisphaera araneosa HTCC2155 TaxID=313628 RepID=A6DHK3_9BACT|nr:ribosome recycling factor [Lentisphaera araneosa]EDM29086.1 ribosome releasing factor [Lentisphaera araneosa HTCC2155]